MCFISSLGGSNLRSYAEWRWVGSSNGERGHCPEEAVGGIPRNTELSSPVKESRRDAAVATERILQEKENVQQINDDVSSSRPPRQQRPPLTFETVESGWVAVDATLRRGLTVPGIRPIAAENSTQTGGGADEVGAKSPDMFAVSPAVESAKSGPTKRRFLGLGCF